MLLSALCLCAASAGRYDIMPWPANLTEKEGFFEFKKGMVMAIPKGEQYASAAAMLTGKMAAAGAPALTVVQGASKGDIVARLNGSIPLEGYTLSVTEKNIEIGCSTPAGFFYALATLRQMLPVAVYGGYMDGAQWRVACVKIEDSPRFAYRGSHLDCCRHFMPIEFVYKHIDLMSQYKLNRFHWHLTDDQGWRIEIKKYPKLTEVGAWRDSTVIGHYKSRPVVYDHVKVGGFYTQEQVREVVAYAAARNITVIPEIELPGHALAAITAYPWLSCGLKEQYAVAGTWGVFEDVFCPREETMKFFEDVLTEVIELFPGQYIHIGGDECPKTAWKRCPHCQALIKKEGLKDEHQLQSWVTHRMDAFVASKGRTIIGWDEILEGGVSPNAVVHSWRGYQGGIEAAGQKHMVVMSPHKKCYLDYYQEPAENAPLAIGGFIPLDSVYLFEPVPPQLSRDEQEYIWGPQANCWTEYMKTPAHVEYMLYPRLVALAEVGWTPAGRKDLDSFHGRIQTEFDRFDRMGVNACQYERKTPN